MKLTDTCSSHFYQAWISNHVPSAVVNWEAKGFQLNWEKIFEIPYSCTMSTRLQTLHYRIVHRFIPTNKFLFTRRVIASAKCSYCDQIDTLEHFIHGCTKIKSIWQKAFRVLGICVQDQLLACLFGIVGGKEGHNAIVLLINPISVRGG